MIAYLRSIRATRSDQILAATARTLRAEGVRIAGVIQLNSYSEPFRRRQMDLECLDSGRIRRISRDTFGFADQRRIDAQTLKGIADCLHATMAESDPQLVILNRFGHQEAQGNGLSPVFAQALDRKIPLVTSLAPPLAEAFRAALGEAATELADDLDAVLDWARAATARRAA